MPPSCWSRPTSAQVVKTILPTISPECMASKPVRASESGIVEWIAGRMSRSTQNVISRHR